jgi:AraC-like DNA-binding protein
MDYLYRINTVNDYNADNNQNTLHPLVSVIDFSKANPRDWGNYKKIMFQYGLYCVYLKDVKCGDLRYGRHYYDYQAGTLAFFAPGQVTEIENPGQPYQPMGFGLVFHPDFLVGTSLEKNMRDYKFFDYESNEALHLSEDERQLILDSFQKINFELKQPIDKHSKKLIAASIGLFLDYCLRFYDRQFITREVINKGILERFEVLLNAYFNSDKPQAIGLPSVAYFANELHLSPNYFGDLIKKETGQSAKDYVLNKTIESAKRSIVAREHSINEIAYALGFKYPQHFSRLFKQKVGLTPNAFRSMN